MKTLKIFERFKKHLSSVYICTSLQNNCKNITRNTDDTHVILLNVEFRENLIPFEYRNGTCQKLEKILLKETSFKWNLR